MSRDNNQHLFKMQSIKEQRQTTDFIIRYYDYNCLQYKYRFKLNVGQKISFVCPRDLPHSPDAKTSAKTQGGLLTI